MSDKNPPGRPEPDADPGQEGFLSRWARLKEAARKGDSPVAPEAGPPEGKPVSPAAGGPAETAQESEPVEPPGDEDMPPLESLGQDSDYSAFMSPRVSPDLRQKALRQLFRSPKFNITDGLDDYCEDFTKWRPLGGIVTADMKYHVERKLREQLEKAGESAETEEEAVASAPDVPAGGGTEAAGDLDADSDTDIDTDSNVDAAGKPVAKGDQPNEPGNA